MDILIIQNILNYLNIGLEGASVVFITFVFFDLIFVDETIELSGISEKFSKFKRYDIFKNSLIFLVLSIYFGLFGKLAVAFDFPIVAFTLFSLIGNVFLLAFSYKLYQLIHNYVPDKHKEKEE
jgi:hypothetical protein